jgi:hypothetical protein
LSVGHAIASTGTSTGKMATLNMTLINTEDSTVKLAVKYGTPASTTGGFGLPQALDSTSWETQSSRLLPHHGCAGAGRH